MFDDSPLTIDNGTVTTSQICYTREAGDYDDGETTSDTSDDYSGGSAIVLEADDDVSDDFPADFAHWNFELDYTIPAESFGAQVRDDSEGPEFDASPEIEWSLFHSNGTEYHLATVPLGADLGLNWSDLIEGSYTGAGYNGPDLEPGAYRLQAVCTDSEGSIGDREYLVDVVAPYDRRHESSLDFDNSVHEPSGYLDGPELYPELIDVELEQINTRRDVTEARVASSWDDVSNNQYIALSNDGETFIQTDNSDSATAEFAEPSTSVFVKFGLSRYPVSTNPQNATPRFGYNGQTIDSYDLFANPDSILPAGIGVYDVRSVIPAGEVDATIREGGLLSDDDTLLSRSIYSGLDVGNRQLISNERGRFDSR